MTRSVLLLVALASPSKGRPRIPGEPLQHAAQPFLYAGYYQMAGATTAGAGATMKQGDPGLAAPDFHSLGEIGVISADLKQIVELGWTVDPQVNNDVHPRLFVFHWVDGMPTCYNGCGFVQVSTTHHPGDRVTPGVLADYAIELRGSDWWLRYENDDLGYFPGSLWAMPYTASGHVQWFGEISSGGAESCTEMGNGARGNNPDAAAMSGLYLVAPDGSHVPANAGPGEITNPLYWSVGQQTPTSFAFGGPGAALCCTPATCADSMAACGAVPDDCQPVIKCGDCSADTVCDETFQCGPPPPPGDKPPADDAGCCAAGSSPTRALPALLVLALALRRRRSR